MAFTSTATPAGLVCIGFGTPTVDVTGSTAAASVTTVTLTNFQGGTTGSNGTIRTGWIKVRLIGVTSLVPTVMTITGTNGTTTVTLAWENYTSATSGQGIERLIPFMSELNLNSVSINFTHTGSTTPTLDCEIVGNP